MKYGVTKEKKTFPVVLKLLCVHFDLKCPLLIEPREEVKLRNKQFAGEAVEIICFEKVGS